MLSGLVANAFKEEYECHPSTKGMSIEGLKAAETGYYFVSNWAKAPAIRLSYLDVWVRRPQLKSLLCSWIDFLSYAFVIRINRADGAKDFCELFKPNNGLSCGNIFLTKLLN